MLTCSVDADDSSGWNYQWFKRTTDSFEEISLKNDHNKTISVTKGGIYRCRGGRGDSIVFTKDSNVVTIHKIGEYSNLFRHKIRCICDYRYCQKLLFIFLFLSKLFGIFVVNSIQQGCCDSAVQLHSDIQRWDDHSQMWDRGRWRHRVDIWMETPTSNISRLYYEYKIDKAIASNKGEYQCKGRHRGDFYSSTNWSQAITLTVFGKFDHLSFIGKMSCFHLSVHPLM